MVQEAEQFAEEDKKRRESAESKNQAESLVHSTEQQLKEHGDKIDDDLKQEIETQIAKTKTAIEGDDSEAMKTESEELAQKAMAMGQKIYEAQQAEAGDTDAAAADAAASEEEDVVDAEFSEVDENADADADADEDNKAAS